MDRTGSKPVNPVRELEKGRRAAAVGILVIVLLLGSAINLGVTMRFPAALASSLAPNGKIAFTSDRDGLPVIYTMSADGSGVKRLGNLTFVGGMPSWSSDASKVAFAASSGNGNDEIFSMNAKGTGLTDLTHNPGVPHSSPSWSPDGTKIAFSEMTHLGVTDLFVMNADGTNPVGLTNSSAFYTGNGGASWSPDGTKIAFTKSVRNSQDMLDETAYVVNVDGSGLRELVPTTKASAPEWSPDGKAIVLADNGAIAIIRPDGSGETEIARGSNPHWSPDGTKIVFETTNEVHVVTVDGTGETSLGEGREATWSPDGTKIAFSGSGDGNYEIYVANSDGTGLTRLTNNPASDFFPVWLATKTNEKPTTTPNGKIAFSSNGNIFTINLDGTGLIDLTNSTLNVRSGPSWSPDGSKIAFSGEKGGYPDGYVMNADGTGLKALSKGGEGDSMPVWSPDGTKLAYSCRTSMSTWDICVVNPDGSGRSVLTANATLITHHAFGIPAWSLDGKKIAFSDGIMQDAVELYVMNSKDGSGLVRLTNNTANDVSPAWSPDGARLAFVSNRDGNNEIYVMGAADGSGPVALTNTVPPPSTDPSRTISNENPSWSPDGTKVLFTRGGSSSSYANFTTTSSILVVDANGSNERILANGTLTTSAGGKSVADPAWSPDGKKIIFSETEGPTYYPNQSTITSLNVINPDGTGLVRLTNTGGRNPDWSGQMAVRNYTLEVKSLDLFNNKLDSIPTTIRNVNGTIKHFGFTPLAFTGASGTTYKVSVADIQDASFDHWEDGSKNRDRAIPLWENTTFTAYYNKTRPEDTTIISKDVNLDSFTVKKGEVVTISPNASVEIGVLTNNGTIVNNGYLETRSAGSLFTNYGNFTNYGTFGGGYNSGRFSEIRNHGSIVNRGTSEIYFAAVNNHGGIIDSFGTTVFSGTTINNSDGGSIIVRENASLSLPKYGSYYAGQIINGPNSVIDNFGTISSNAYGTGQAGIQNDGIMYRECGGTFLIPVGGNPVIFRCGEVHPTVSVSPISGSAWTTVSVRGSDFASLSQINFTLSEIPLHTFPQQVYADANGNFAAGIIIPKNVVPGKHLVNATDSNGKSDAVEFLVNSPPSSMLPADNGKIAFVSNRTGDYEIYSMNADGTSLTDLTNRSDANDYSPTWSPDGKKIAFGSYRNDQNGLYIMNADGTNQTKISGFSGPMRWSPDGSRIIFEGYYMNGWSQMPAIFVMNADGTEITKLVDESGIPAWSPDGSKLVFTSGRDGVLIQSRYLASEIYVMNADGTNQTRLTNNTVSESDPSWSPDGSKIAFSMQTNDTTSGIYTMDVAGNHIMRLTDIKGAFETQPRWSPDGTKIVFSSNREGNYEIYVMNADGTNQTRLTHDSSLDGSADWGSQFMNLDQRHNVRVSAVDLSGNPVDGVQVVIRAASNGTILESGFTPLEFTGVSGSRYQVSVANYVGKSFVHWDDATTTNTRTFQLPLDSPMAVTATYDTGNSLRGFTPLAYPAADGNSKPKLVVNAIGLEHEKELHMAAIVDPLVTNTTTGTTTYAVVVEDYNNTKFDHWNDGSKNSTRIFAIDRPTNITAFFREDISDSNLSKNGNILVEVEPLNYTMGGKGAFMVSPDGTRIWNGCSNCFANLSPDGTKIAYTTLSKGLPDEIFVTDIRNNATTNLTKNPMLDSFSAWSPDGKQIAFASNRDSGSSFGPYDAYSMNSDGTGVKRLTDYPNNEWAGQWSPDGSKLLLSKFEAGSTKLFIMNSDGTGAKKLTDSKIYALHWSPDNSKIFFFGGSSHDDIKVNLFVINADGSGLTQLTREGLGYFMAKMLNGDEFLYNIAWSPDSSNNSKIAFVTTSRENGTDSIYVMNADGASLPTKIADNPGTVYTTVTWSPDGTKIAFVLTDKDGKHAIYLSNPDGTGRTRLTAAGSDNFGPIWSPDGARIAFTSTRDGPEQVYIMNAIDGSEQEKLTHGGAIERQFASQWPAAPTLNGSLSS